MERLTKTDGLGNGDLIACFGCHPGNGNEKCGMCERPAEAYNKLAEYEDLQEQGQIFDPVEMAKIAMMQIELKKYKDAESDGRLVVLPCRPDSGAARMGYEMEMTNIRQQLYDTAESAGLPILSGDKCCRLLAWLYVFGGSCEAVTMDERLSNDILYAQKRLNVVSGELPDAELLPILQRYVRQTGGYDKPHENAPEWVSKLEAEYGICGKR